MATHSLAADRLVELADVSRRVKAIFIGSIGNLVEWYDFYTYAAFALYFAASFFPGQNAVVQQLNAAVLFAIGFIVRPVGGWLFGHLADQYGRRKALMWSVLLMCFGSLMIAIMPTYASVGIWAPVLLGAVRMIQGLSLGGEYGTSATYLTEVADEKHRGFYSSFQYVTLIGGQLCAILVLLLLQRLFLSEAELRAWGWRIPFLIGALLAIVALLMRRNLHETDDFLAAMQEGDYKAAKDMFTKEVERAAYYHEFHYWLALAYVGLGEMESARKHMTIAIDNSTTSKDHQLYAAKLGRIQAMVPVLRR